jgi:hypothetical protein
VSSDEYRPPVTPFGGWVTDRKLARLVPLQTAPHILGLAPPGTGKTRRWLAQSAVLWPGPAVVSSSKDDLMQMVSSRRWGRGMLLDLRPITPPHYPSDFTCCRYDPTALITTLEDAQAAAETLLSMSSVGFGGTQARPALRGVRPPQHWWSPVLEIRGWRITEQCQCPKRSKMQPTDPTSRSSPADWPPNESMPPLKPREPCPIHSP